MQLQSTNEIKAASFHNGIVRLDLQVSLIVKLLSLSIRESKALNKSDIVDCYLEFIFYGKGETIYRMGLDNRRYGMTDRDGNVTKEYLKNKLPQYTENAAIQWFKKHLGSAILKGKLLAIPVIEV